MRKVPLLILAFVLSVATVWIFSPVSHELDPEHRRVESIAPTPQRQPLPSLSRRQKQVEAMGGGGKRRPPVSTKSSSPTSAVSSSDDRSSSVATNDNGINQQRSSTKIHFITVQTNPSPGWCRMLLSAHLSGVFVHNLAWNHKYEHIKRPRWILDWIAERQNKFNLRDSDILMFGDGGDTVFSGISLDDVRDDFVDATPASFDEWVSSDHWLGKRGADDEKRCGNDCLPPVFFNAEANCYHKQAFSSGSWGVKKGSCIAAYKRAYPNVTSRYRYLNAGAWIGRVWAVKKAFGIAKAMIDKQSSLWCDQSVMGSIYLTNAADGLVGLDTANRYFLPTYHLREAIDFCSSVEPQRKEEKDRPRLKMCKSGNIPALLHFNGKSEGAFTSSVLRRTTWFGEKGSSDVLEKLDKVKSSATELHSSKGAMRQMISQVCPKLVFPS